MLLAGGPARFGLAFYQQEHDIEQASDLLRLGLTAQLRPRNDR